MYSIFRISKIVVIAFSITCTILFLQYSSPVVNLDSRSKLVSEIALVFQKLLTKTVQAFPKHFTDSFAVPKTPFSDSSSESPVNDSTPIWAKIGQQLNLDHASQNPRVQAEMRKILADKKSFENILKRSAPYIYYIYSQTKDRDLPAEIALIPIIESEYNPNDHNSIGATGLWQLMPGTARELGLKVGNGDDRYNIIHSTNAALAFFNDLGTQFHDNWNLAFAAYNCGSGCVASAIKKADSDDFFNLKLPLETQLYVPRLLAIALLIKNAKKYGIALPPIKDEPYFKEVEVDKSESLSSYADSTGADLETLEKLNPDFKHEKVTETTNVLLVPVESQLN